MAMDYCTVSTVFYYRMYILRIKISIFTNISTVKNCGDVDKKKKNIYIYIYIKNYIGNLVKEMTAITTIKIWKTYSEISGIVNTWKNASFEVNII